MSGFVLLVAPLFVDPAKAGGERFRNARERQEIASFAESTEWVA